MAAVDGIGTPGRRGAAVGSDREREGCLRAPPGGAAQDDTMSMIDPSRRMSRVPPSAATAASKQPPSRSALDALVTDEPWIAAVELFRTRNPRRLERITDYDRLLDGGDHLRIAAAVLDCAYRPAPPAEGWINKLDGRKKRMFRY